MTGTKTRRKSNIADYRKIQALIRVAKGVSRTQIARDMHVHTSTVSLWTKNPKLLKQFKNAAPVEYTLLTGRTNGVQQAVSTPLIAAFKPISTTNITKIGTANLTGYVFSDNVGNHTLIPVSKLRELFKVTL